MKGDRLARLLLAFYVGVPIAGLAQDAPAQAAFEVASIRSSARQPPDRTAIGLKIDGAQVRCTFMALKDYLTLA